MKTNRYILLVIFIFSLLASLLIFGTYVYVTKKQNELLANIYETTHKNIIETTKSSIDDKKHTTLAIAIALSKNENLYRFLETEQYHKLEYDKVIDELRDNSKYKNVWIQIINKDAKPIYKSWTSLKDNIAFRKDLQSSLANQKISTSIGMGIFNLSLKARAPIYDYEKKFYGVLEIITHLNSIVVDLEKNKIKSLILVDKENNKVLKYPISNVFIDDYYVAHNNADMEFVSYLRKHGAEKYFNMSSYIVENGYLISKYDLYNENNKKVASILNFINLSDINIEHLNSIKMQNIMLSIIILIVLIFIVILYFYSIYIRKIKSEEKKNRLILDSQSNIIVITDGNQIIDSNKKLLEFFIDINTLEEFKDKYLCVCKAFINMESDYYLTDKDYDGKNWAEHALENKDKDFKVAMLDFKENVKHFSVKMSKASLEEYIIVTFTDITNELLQIEKEKQQDLILFRQSKINAITNTLNNIAHQWRQPLSIISTITSAMKLKKELNRLKDNDFFSSCDMIVNNTQKLSNTIESFSKFFMQTDTQSSFSFVEIMENTINFLESIFEKNSIKYEFKYDKDFILNCDYNDFTEAILNIFDNSIYALNENKSEGDRYILISLENKVLTIQDSANGIDEEVISKILEPYFTTKHQSFGVGLGLYVVHKFFQKDLNFKVDFKNEIFEYNNKKHKGLKFIIDFS